MRLIMLLKLPCHYFSKVFTIVIIMKIERNAILTGKKNQGKGKQSDAAYRIQGSTHWTDYKDDKSE